jgi:hypothetical protein
MQRLAQNSFVSGLRPSEIGATMWRLELGKFIDFCESARCHAPPTKNEVKSWDGKFSIRYLLWNSTNFSVVDRTSYLGCLLSYLDSCCFSVALSHCHRAGSGAEAVGHMECSKLVYSLYLSMSDLFFILLSVKLLKCEQRSRISLSLKCLYIRMEQILVARKLIII